MNITYANTAVTAIINSSNFYIFCTPLILLNECKDELLFHFIGGQVIKNEKFSDAILREVFEETGASGCHITESKSLLINSSGSISHTDLQLSPSPYLIYHRLPRDSGFFHDRIEWVLAYNVSISQKILSPMSEVQALLFLSEDAVRRAVNGTLTFNDVLTNKFESRIITKQPLHISKHAPIKPSGLADVWAKYII